MAARRAPASASVPGSVHLAEDPAERRFLVRGDGPFADLLDDIGVQWTFAGPYAGPVDWLAQIGALGPQTLAVHGVDLTPHERQQLAGRAVPPRVVGARGRAPRLQREQGAAPAAADPRERRRRRARPVQGPAGEVAGGPRGVTGCRRACPHKQSTIDRGERKQRAVVGKSARAESAAAPVLRAQPTRQTMAARFLPLMALGVQSRSGVLMGSEHGKLTGGTCPACWS